MLYFKFTNEDGVELYGSITIDNFDKATPERQKNCLDELKKICHAESLEVVSKEEYDKQDER